MHAAAALQSQLILTVLLALVWQTQQVDQHNGVQCSQQALQPIALQECLKHITKLTIWAPPAEATNEAAAMYGPQLPLPYMKHSYPCLQELVVMLPQPCLCFPSARCVPKLRLLQLQITDITSDSFHWLLNNTRCFEVLEGETCEG